MKNYRRAKHLMVDLETLGLEVDAVILSVGMVGFEFIPEPADELRWGVNITGEYLTRLNVRHQLMDGRTVTPTTLTWWASPAQRLAAAQEREHKDVISPYDTWQGMYKFVQGIEKDYVWCQGAAFDFPKLASFTAAYGGGAELWPFYVERDSRTLIGGTDVDKGKIVVDGPAHNPLSDCRRQIEAMRLALFGHNE